MFGRQHYRQSDRSDRVTNLCGASASVIDLVVTSQLTIVYNSFANNSCSFVLLSGLILPESRLLKSLPMNVCGKFI
jgi:hypothetical protein